MLRFFFICLLAALGSVCLLDRADAGGYPPFGAWAYGSGHHGYRGKHHGFHRHRPVGWYGPSWHARYHWAKPRHVGYSFAYRPFTYRTFSYRHWGPHFPVSHYSYRVFPYHHVSSVRFVAPIYFYARPSVVYYPPVCRTTLPVVLPATSYVSNSTSSLTSRVVGNFSVPSPVDIALQSRKQLDLPSTGVQATGAQARGAQGQFVNLVSHDELPNRPQSIDYGVPDELLAAADAIFKAGGYREAARAYAQLSVRFGSSPPLLARRFVSQVLIRELDQAEIILQLCEVSNSDMLASDLAHGGLSEFVGSPLLIEASSEALAARALARSSDPLPLRSVAQWLELSNDHERAAMFRLAAQQLKSASQQEEVSSELVVFD